MEITINESERRELEEERKRERERIEEEEEDEERCDDMFIKNTKIYLHLHEKNLHKIEIQLLYSIILQN